MRCKTKQEEDSRSVDLRVSSHAADTRKWRPVQLQFKNWGWKINDRRLEEIRETEFGLPPSNYEGRFGNGAPFAIFIDKLLIKLQSIPSPYRRSHRFFAPSDAVP